MPKSLIEPGLEVPLLGQQSKTDKEGAVTFCGVPPDTRLELVILLPDDDPELEASLAEKRQSNEKLRGIPGGFGAKFHRIAFFNVRPGELTSRTASVRPPESK